ncbi:MAG: threonine synthase [Candidatus Odinarchaeota archaeon]
MINNGSCLTKLECTYCKKEYDPREKHTICKSCGKVLYPKYDLEKARETLSKESIRSRTTYNIWRLPEIMPVYNPLYRYTLGEGWTPVVALQNLGKVLGLRNLCLKDEGKNPTGTFKSRGLCSAVSKAIELGIKELVMPTAGNAGAALSAYAARAGVKAHVFAPRETPGIILKEIRAMGGELMLVPGVITDAGKEARNAAEKYGYFDVSTLKEPYRVEGKKTMGLELAEQLNWSLPDVIVYPTGGGTGIVGMHKAFDELEELGLIDGHRPRMVSVQSSGCAPIVRAFNEGKEQADPWENSKTIAAGLRVPAAIGDYLILRAIRESGGTAIMVDESDIKKAMYGLARTEGIMVSTEAAATVTAVKQLAESGFIGPDDRTVLFATGSGLTTPDDW